MPRYASAVNAVAERFAHLGLAVSTRQTLACLVFRQNIPAVYDILKRGSEEARRVAASTLDDVRRAMRINYFDDMDLAGSVVLSRTQIGPNELWGGAPAKFIKMVDPEQSKEINRPMTGV